MLTAVPTVARLQPNSSRSGSMRMPGVDRKPAAPSSVTNDAREDDPRVVEPVGAHAGTVSVLNQRRTGQARGGASTYDSNRRAWAATSSRTMSGDSTSNGNGSPER